jgi:hypothetical protein
MHRRRLIRLSTVAIVLFVALTDDPRSLAGWDGCGYSCQDLSQIGCLSPIEDDCLDEAMAECYNYYYQLDPDCQRACRVEGWDCSEGLCPAGSVLWVCAIGDTWN